MVSAFCGGNMMYAICHGQYDRSRLSQHYSSDMTRQVQKLLTVDPDHRPSADQILNKNNRGRPR